MKGFNITKPSFLIILTVLFLLPLTIIPHPISSAKVPETYTNFIKKSCNTTTYPYLCIKTLSRYAATVKKNRLKLCSASLRVAVRATRRCSSSVCMLTDPRYITRPEALAVKDCIENLEDAVDQLKQTVNAMDRLGGADRKFQWDNAKTYASAAITDADTCLDGFSGRKVKWSVKSKIKRCVSRVEKLMSNALSLINHLY